MSNENEKTRLDEPIKRLEQAIERKRQWLDERERMRSETFTSMFKEWWVKFKNKYFSSQK